MKLDFKASSPYYINYKTGAVKVSGFFGGLSFLLLAIYYFGFTNLKDCSGGEVFLSILLPMILLAAFIILLAGVRLAAAPAYGILGAAYCVFMILRAMTYSSKLNMVFALLWYLLAAAVYLATACSLIPTRVPMGLVLIVPAAIRLLIDVKGYLLQKQFLSFLTAASAICGLMAFGLLAFCLQAEPAKRRVKPES